MSHTNQLYNPKILSGAQSSCNLQTHSQASSAKLQKQLALKQIHDIISDMYTQKVKYDKKCQENEMPTETMEEYMYTYLNQRYGLRSLTISWASQII